MIPRVFHSLTDRCSDPGFLLPLLFAESSSQMLLPPLNPTSERHTLTPSTCLYLPPQPLTFFLGFRSYQWARVSDKLFLFVLLVRAWKVTVTLAPSFDNSGFKFTELFSSQGQLDFFLSTVVLHLCSYTTHAGYDDTVINQAKKQCLGNHAGPSSCIVEGINLSCPCLS